MTYLIHSGIKGMHWGVRRWQNEDGTLTEAGKRRYKVTSDGKIEPKTVREMLIERRKEFGANLKRYKEDKDYRKEVTIKHLKRGAIAAGVVVGAKMVKSLAKAGIMGLSFKVASNPPSLDKIQSIVSDSMKITTSMLDAEMRNLHGAAWGGFGTGVLR